MSQVGPFPAVPNHAGNEVWFPACPVCHQIKRMYWNSPSDIQYTCKCGKRVNFTTDGWEAKFIFCRDPICKIEC